MQICTISRTQTFLNDITVSIFSLQKKTHNKIQTLCCQKDIREFKKTTTATATGRLITKRFNEQNNGVHVRYNSWYISLPSSAKQQREMTKFCVV